VAINPPSDILLDVASAANPGKLRAATQRLEENGSGESGVAFTTALESVAAAAKAADAVKSADPVKPAPAAVTSTLKDKPAALLPRESQAKAMEKFEAFFLQTAVEAMLPKNAENVFGSGTAGDIWRSMLAEQVAAEIAKGAKFGIAQQLAGGHFGSGPRKSGAQPSPAIGGAESVPPNNNLPYVQEQPLPKLISSDIGRAGAARTSRS
jgi:flagellar protein FlgJ